MIEQNEKPAFFAIIPASVRYDKNITAHAKLLYGEITALCNKEGFCWASNNYFARLYDVHKNTISKWISQLAKNNYISIKIKNADSCYDRKLYITPQQEQTISTTLNKKLNTPKQKADGPLNKKLNTPKQKAEHINTYNNTKNKTNNIYILDLWNSLNIRNHKKEIYLNHLKAKHTKIFDMYHLDEIKQAIKNYAEIVQSDDYYFSYVWPLWDFLTRGLDKFLDEAKPHQNYKIAPKKQKAQDQKFIAWDGSTAEERREQIEFYRKRQEEREAKGIVTAIPEPSEDWL